MCLSPAHHLCYFDTYKPGSGRNDLLEYTSINAERCVKIQMNVPHRSGLRRVQYNKQELKGQVN